MSALQTEPGMRPGSIRQASDTNVSDSMVQNGSEPAMGVGHGYAGTATQPVPPGTGRPGAPPRGPLASRLAWKIDLRLSGDLREAVRKAAKARGLTDGAYVRTLVADAVGEPAPSDRETGLRKREPSPLLAAAATAVREIGAAHTPLAGTRPDVEAVRAALGRARTALMSVIKEESRNV